MTQIATYTMEAFLDDVRQVFASSKDALVQAQAVKEYLERLMAVPGWLEAQIDIPEEGGFGRYDLHYEENVGHPAPGFYFMATFQKPDQTQLPHDHGAAWVVYGVYKGSIRQGKWRWYHPGEGVDSLQLKEYGSFVQESGSAAFFLPGEVHQTLNVTGGRALVVRFESQKLDQVTRYQINPETNAVTVMDR